jgi:hypothetical protein
MSDSNFSPTADRFFRDLPPSLQILGYYLKLSQASVSSILSPIHHASHNSIRIYTTVQLITQIIRDRNWKLHTTRQQVYWIIWLTFMATSQTNFFKIRQLTSPRISIRPHTTTRNEMMGFSLKLMLQNSANICGHNQFWLQWDKKLTLYMKIHMCFCAYFKLNILWHEGSKPKF